VSPRTIKPTSSSCATPLSAYCLGAVGLRPTSYEKPCDILPLLRLTADEALALAIAGQTFAAWRGSPLGRALTEALHKIAGVVGGGCVAPGQ